MPKITVIVGAIVIIGLGALLLFSGEKGEESEGGGGEPVIKRKEVVKPDTTYFGEEQPYGGGTVRTYISLLSGNPHALGVEFTASALNGLDTPDREIILHVPEQATITPFSWVMLNFESEGHQSLGVYEVPHIDFHFFMMDENMRGEIKPGLCDDAPELLVDCETFQRGMIQLPSQFQPKAHESLGSVEEGTGNHLINLGSQEFNGEFFTHTFIYGTYDGELTFFEPMISREYLLRKPKDICSKTEIPGAFAEPGWYPTRYCMWQHESSDTYTVSLERFEYFEAN